MKKLLATLLTVTMLGSVSVPALAAEQPADTSGSANNNNANNSNGVSPDFKRTGRIETFLKGEVFPVALSPKQHTDADGKNAACMAGRRILFHLPRLGKWYAAHEYPMTRNGMYDQRRKTQRKVFKTLTKKT